MAASNLKCTEPERYVGFITPRHHLPPQEESGLNAGASRGGTIVAYARQRRHSTRGQDNGVTAGETRGGQDRDPCTAASLLPAIQGRGPSGKINSFRLPGTLSASTPLSQDGGAVLPCG